MRSYTIGHMGRKQWIEKNYVKQEIGTQTQNSRHLWNQPETTQNRIVTATANTNQTGRDHERSQIGIIGRDKQKRYDTIKNEEFKKN